MTQAANLAAEGSNVNSSGVLQVAGGGTGATTQAGAAAAVLPTQTGNSGKYLTTDGTNTSWGTVTSNPGTVTSITAGTGLSGGTITSSGTVAIANTTVTAGSYTNASVTVNAQGQLTAASSGTAPVTSVGAGTGISSSGGTTPTITNTGVTSVSAGTGISLSGSTGGVTITNSSPNQLTTTTGSPSYYGARAWVNFQGGNGSTAGTINSSVNVSSISVNGTGAYSVNFSTSMPDANYAVSVTANQNAGGSGAQSFAYMYSTPSTSSVAIGCINGSGGLLTNMYQVHVVVHR